MEQETLEGVKFCNGLLIMAAALTDSLGAYKLRHLAEFTVFFGEALLVQPFPVAFNESEVEQFFLPSPLPPLLLSLLLLQWDFYRSQCFGAQVQLSTVPQHQRFLKFLLLHDKQNQRFYYKGKHPPNRWTSSPSHLPPSVSSQTLSQ